MPELLLLRHAKSSWDDPSLKDIERPLSGRGIKSAAAMGREIDRLALAPRKILCSPAQRTRETLAVASEFSERLGDYQVEQRLYGAPVQLLMEIIRATDPACPSLMLVGHNPATEFLALALTDGQDSAARRTMAMKYPTGALAQIQFDCDWRSVVPGSGELVRFIRPRDL